MQTRFERRKCNQSGPCSSPTKICMHKLLLTQHHAPRLFLLLMADHWDHIELLAASRINKYGPSEVYTSQMLPGSWGHASWRFRRLYTLERTPGEVRNRGHSWINFSLLFVPDGLYLDTVMHKFNMKISLENEQSAALVTKGWPT